MFKYFATGAVSLSEFSTASGATAEQKVVPATTGVPLGSTAKVYPSTRHSVQDWLTSEFPAFGYCNQELKYAGIIDQAARGSNSLQVYSCSEERTKKYEYPADRKIYNVANETWGRLTFVIVSDSDNPDKVQIRIHPDGFIPLKDGVLTPGGTEKDVRISHAMLAAQPGANRTVSLAAQFIGNDTFGDGGFGVCAAGEFILNIKTGELVAINANTGHYHENQKDEEVDVIARKALTALGYDLSKLTTERAVSQAAMMGKDEL